MLRINREVLSSIHDQHRSVHHQVDHYPSNIATLIFNIPSTLKDAAALFNELQELIEIHLLE